MQLILFIYFKLLISAYFISLKPSQPDNVPSQTDSQAGPKMVIWGTDVDVSECKKTFRRFIENFIDPNMEPDEANLAITDVNEPLYMQKMKEVKI